MFTSQLLVLDVRLFDAFA
ncbi:DUF645 family protein [Vibrio cholerae]